MIFYNVDDATGELVPVTATAPIGPATKLSSLQRGVGTAAALAAGGFGIYSGIRQGGLQGGLTAAGSVAGTGAALLSLAGVSGPAAPVLAAVGLGLSLGAALLGDPKQKRDAKINRTLNDARFTDPVGFGGEFDLATGGALDFDKRGRTRVIQQVTVQVNAMDSKSFIDHAADISLAVRQALQDGSPLGDQILSTVGVNR
jgi:hypothetical protein